MKTEKETMEGIVLNKPRVGNPNLARDRAKAQLSPLRGKHGKRKTTLQKEELRAKFVDYFGERMVMLMETIENSVKGGDSNAAFKALEQLIGSPEKDKSGDTNILMTGRPVLILGGLTQIKKDE